MEWICTNLQMYVKMRNGNTLRFTLYLYAHLFLINCYTVADCGNEPFKSTLDSGSIEYPEKNSTFFGSVIKYTCKEGYTISGGNNMRVCTKEGKWSGSEPKCLSKKKLSL
jgi:hypothetical protein